MTPKTKRRVIVSSLLLVLALVILAISGCNTWHGAGRDVENAGKDMQHD